jgi:hypothetical protein
MNNALTVPPGGVWLGLSSLHDASVKLGCFAKQPLVPVPLPPGDHAAALRIPPDLASMPWRLLVRARGAIRVCGLG